MARSAARVLVDTLDAHGVDVAYCVPGESFLPITDAFLERPLGPRNSFIAATVGAMGAAVPSGVAAGISTPGRQVVTFVGDGGALMTGNELATAIQYEVPLKLFIADNRAFGTIRMHQARSFPGPVTSTALVNPDFARWGEAFGARGFHIERDADVEPVVAEAMAHEGAAVVEVRTSLSHISPAATLEEIEARAGA